MKALLVIDVQNDFLPPNGSLAVADGDKIVHPIIKLMHDESQDWHRIVFTRDWHPKNHISFAKNHGLPDFSKFNYKSPRRPSQPLDTPAETKEATLWPVHCIQNTRGSQLADALLKEVEHNHHKIVDKGYLSDREYYSAFNDIWNFHRTELNDYLQKHHITQVYIVGLALDFCVKNTAMSAASLGYETFIMEDYCKPIDSSEAAMKALHEDLTENYGIKFI
ncbi:hypothetical protein KAFR_0F03650 [Kazachstania africana CBS 2517]|uniref:nicotinamidase n=1 Tax=Kazachstania africana (strain ATCC 22294 / BCRC 22015 / CBS 2517 / CECT 1963 / NBRC 1671 / NRRL Y-8276) TaxID=1071382 RepID=H2AX61_KAZAF|nr:hypothetical protein KAFR_0F03650 [Kazachstania africana CBS 2517]CCF58961.1 hypothetical protein KAFR_0F03650 [Kazachstania africana CBS 2517]